MNTVIDWYRAQAEKYGEDAACLMGVAPDLSGHNCAAAAANLAREAGHYGRLVLRRARSSRTVPADASRKGAA